MWAAARGATQRKNRLKTEWAKGRRCPVRGTGVPIMTTANNPRPPSAPAGARKGLPELWTVTQVARYLGVSTKRIYDFIARGLLDSFKIGPRGTRVTRASVEAMLERQLSHQRSELGLDIVPREMRSRRRQ